MFEYIIEKSDALWNDMCIFPQYKNILGSPNKGIHFHVGGVAIVDCFLSFLLVFFIAWLFDFNRYETMGLIVFIFILKEILHAMFCIK